MAGHEAEIPTPAGELDEEPQMEVDAQIDRKRAREDEAENEHHDGPEKMARATGDNDMDLGRVSRETLACRTTSATNHDMNAEPTAPMFNGDEWSESVKVKYLT